jgi:hypothetical protein
MLDLLHPVRDDLTEWICGLPQGSNITGGPFSPWVSWCFAASGRRPKTLWKSGFDLFDGTTDGLAVVNGNVYVLNIDGYLYDFAD